MSEYTEHDKNGVSVGLVEKKTFTFAHPPDRMELESGASLGPVTIAYGATLPPIFQNAAFTHKSAESLSRTFSGATDEPIYTRLGNPTNHALEKRLTELEEGKGAIAMASGMAAIANTCMALLRTGDEFVAGRSLFMSTYVLFTSVFKKYGITARLAAPLTALA